MIDVKPHSMLDIPKKGEFALKVPSRGSDQFNLRFPDGMRDRIAHEADKSGRSMNSEIIARLGFTLDRNLGDSQKLNHEIDEWQLRFRESINQIAHLVTEKNAMSFALQKSHDANITQFLYFKTLCKFIISDSSSPDSLKNFARTALEEVSAHFENAAGDRVAFEIKNTSDEVSEIVNDITENARERAEMDAEGNAFGGGTIYTTFDLSQRDPNKIPDPKKGAQKASK